MCINWSTIGQSLHCASLRWLCVGTGLQSVQQSQRRETGIINIDYVTYRLSHTGKFMGYSNY